MDGEKSMKTELWDVTFLLKIKKKDGNPFWIDELPIHLCIVFICCIIFIFDKVLLGLKTEDLLIEDVNQLLDITNK